MLTKVYTQADKAILATFINSWFEYIVEIDLLVHITEVS